MNFRTERELDPLHILGITCTYGGGGGAVDPLRVQTVRDDDGGDGGFAEELRELVANDTRFQGEKHQADTTAYAYCVVMPCAERTLADAVQHGHFAGTAGRKAGPQ